MMKLLLTLVAMLVVLASAKQTTDLSTVDFLAGVETAAVPQQDEIVASGDTRSFEVQAVEQLPFCSSIRKTCIKNVKKHLTQVNQRVGK
jgi:hypothetical protein